MSVADSGELAGVLRRSSSPALNEKVLLYLESLPRNSEYMSPTSAAPSMFFGESRRMTRREWDADDNDGSTLSYGAVNERGEDNESHLNMQEEARDELGAAIPIHSTGMHEPGPNDLPGPRYESYGSSFGNMGPLPNISKTPSQGSRRNSSARLTEDDAPTVTQDDVPPAPWPKPRSRSGSKASNGGDRPLSSKSQHSAPPSRESLEYSKSPPKNSFAQKVNSISTLGGSNRGSPLRKASVILGPQYSHLRNGLRPHPESDGNKTPKALSPKSPSAELNPNEAQIIKDVIASRRSSYALPPSELENEVANSHFHDMDLCILLHQMDDPLAHDVVKQALKKAVRQRVKKLGMKYDSRSIKQYRNSFHDHDPEFHLQSSSQPKPQSNLSQEPPEWAKALIAGISLAHERFDGLDHKIESLKPQNRGYTYEDSRPTDDDHYPEMTPRTQTVNINTAQPTGYTMAESMYPGHEGDGGNDGRYGLGVPTTLDGEARTHGLMSELGSNDSPGQQYLEEELYKLRQRPGGGSQAATHKTWELGAATTRDGFDDYDEDEDEHEHEHGNFEMSGLPEIPTGNYTDRRDASLPPIPEEEHHDLVSSPRSPLWVGKQNAADNNLIPPWQRIHQRILGWAVIWPLSEIGNALVSTNRGNQVNEVALSIWSMQTYKRYIRSKITDNPGGRPDRLFVPPNMAGAISTAVFNGLHGDACGMLRDLWTPFGLEGSPRLIIVLAKHRSDEDHWVVHRFSLSEGTLTTYDTYPERTLPDGRPLGWWFAIRVAWPSAVHQNPDSLTQKMVRLHRPMQLAIDNAVAASGIWRNILMSSRAERSLDLERLRDLINTEVRNLRQRKVQGKLSLSSVPEPKWDELRG